MEPVERLSDEEYYEGHQQGFSFDESESIRRSGSTPLSSIRRNENLNDYELLQCDGLNEVAENTVSSTNLSSFSTPFKTENEQIHNSDKVVNPLDICLKEEKEPVSRTSQAVNAMVSGLEVNLTEFKAKEDKLDLLKKAVNTHDGNSILAVVLFLKNTLKKSIFQRELVKYSDAVNTYLSYLEEEHETDEVANMLLLLDKPDEAAVFKYEAAISVENLERRHKSIENCINTHFQPGVVSNFLRESVLEHKICLSEQTTLKEHLVTSEFNEDQVKELFEKLTGKKCLTGSSALCSLVFSCMNFYKVPSIAFISPDSVKTRYKITTKQFIWCALRVLSAQKLWSDIPDLVLSKTWTGGIKFRSAIAIPKVLTILSKANAPKEVMEKFVSHIEKQELRLVCAKKFNCFSIAIEILKKTKDRKGLIQYMSIIPPNTPEYDCAFDTLHKSGINWRN